MRKKIKYLCIFVASVVSLLGINKDTTEAVLATELRTDLASQITEHNVDIDFNIDNFPSAAWVECEGATIYYSETEGVYETTDTIGYTIGGEYTTYYKVEKDGYESVFGELSVKIRRVHAPNEPPSELVLPYRGFRAEGTIAQGTNERLDYPYNDWVWEEEDQNIPLAIGESYTATAVYRGHYHLTDEELDRCYFPVEVTVTQADCTHDGEGLQILDFEKNNIKKYPESPATCTRDGRAAVTICYYCYREIEGGEILPATGHNYELEYIKEPTCVASGWYEYQCTNNYCVSITREMIEPIGHNLINPVVIEPTLTSDGREVSYCTNCECDIITRIIPKLTLGDVEDTNESEKDNGISAGGTSTGEEATGNPSSVQDNLLDTNKTTKLSKVTLKLVKSKSKKSVFIKWKKVKDADGYEIQYSTKSNIKKAKTVTIKKAKTTSKTIKKLSSKKKYYIRIRAYKNIDKGKVYGKWSSKKSVKIK